MEGGGGVEGSVLDQYMHYEPSDSRRVSKLLDEFCLEKPDSVTVWLRETIWRH